MIPLFCQSRWLDKWKAFIHYFDTLLQKRDKVEWRNTEKETDSDTLSSDSEDDESTKSGNKLQTAKKMTAKFRKNPHAQVLYQNKCLVKRKYR